MSLDELYKIILDRKDHAKDNSYVSELLSCGADKVIQKVGEEATEVVIAAKNQDRQEIISETADLWFHSLIVLAQAGIEPQDIYKELKKRAK